MGTGFPPTSGQIPQLPAHLIGPIETLIWCIAGPGLYLRFVGWWSIQEDRAASMVWTDGRPLYSRLSQQDEAILF